MRMDARQGLLLVLFLAAPALQGQDQDVKQQMLSQVYGQGGETLFCRESFRSDGDIQFNRIYRQQQILDQFDCISQSQCQNRQAYRDAISDPHNIYPVQRRVDLDRRGTQFGDLPDDIKTASDNCPYQLSFQTFDPPEYARGNVARAMLYMHVIHDLPLIGSLEMYQRWSREDPPDDEERERNQAIKAMTGQGNPFIETPGRADEIMPAAPKRLQFGR